MPKISIIIPVYNVEKYLRQCLDSVVNQTLKDIEIICVNDGSTDHSLQILEEYAQYDHRIKVILQENQGVSIARNTGVNNASSDYIFFIDSDDWIELDCLEKLYNKITTTDSDICIYGLKLFDSQSKTYIYEDYFGLSMYKNRCQDVCTYKEIKSAIFERFGAPLKLYRRQFFIENSLFFKEHRFFEDVYPHVKALLSAKRISFLDERLYVYRENREGSIMDSAKNDLRVLDMFINYDDIWNFMSKNNFLYDLEYEFYNFLIHNILFHRNRITSLKVQKIFINRSKKYLMSIKYKNKIKQYKDLLEIYNINFNNKLKLLQQIFSIRNSHDKKHKKITVLGLKIKIRRNRENKIQKEYLANKIPKIIHYCWFGNNKKNELINACMKSWKKYLHNYKIMEWNENDLKNCKNLYVQEAYNAGKYAFVSDYFRLYALYNYGGVYFDTDNEVFKSFDEFLNLDFFTGYENWEGEYFPFTAVVGAKKGNKIIKDLLDEYNDLHFINPDGSYNLYTNTRRVSNYFERTYHFYPPHDGTKPKILEDRCIIYPSNIFCNYEKGVSYAVHHFNGSWLPENAKNKTDKHKFSLKDIFSVYNQNGHKVWNVLGIKMKFRKK